MRNSIISFVIIVPILLGCGLADRVQKAVTESGSNSNTITNVNSNKTLTDTAVDAAVGEKKIGIPECDEALDILSAQANDPDDNFVTKAVKKTALNTFRDHLKQNLEEHKTDKKEVAKFCREFRDGLADSANENSNTK
jgi:hypothetical protein